jgi:hypothetical protein
MQSSRTWTLCFIGVGLLACGGSAPPPEAPEPEPQPAEEPTAPAEAAPKAEEAPASAGLPDACAGKGELCLPPRAFVGRLCKDEYFGAALHLFAKASPFSRGYVRAREVESVNTRGGPTSDTKLVFDEEVLILEHLGNAPGGMQVSGAGGYIVLRWDGTCATLDEHELALRVPPKPKHAPFEWKYIDPPIQDALLKDPRILEARQKQRKECKGSSMGAQSAACVKADTTLNATVVSTLREGGATIPLPEKLP